MQKLNQMVLSFDKQAGKGLLDEWIPIIITNQFNKHKATKVSINQVSNLSIYRCEKDTFHRSEMGNSAPTWRTDLSEELTDRRGRHQKTLVNGILHHMGPLKHKRKEQNEASSALKSSLRRRHILGLIPHGVWGGGWCREGRGWASTLQVIAESSQFITPSRD